MSASLAEISNNLSFLLRPRSSNVREVYDRAAPRYERWRSLR
jgi:hypothetical protein